jgi:hypothetical protein
MKKNHEGGRAGKNWRGCGKERRSEEEIDGGGQILRCWIWRWWRCGGVVVVIRVVAVVFFHLTRFIMGEKYERCDDEEKY